MCMMLYVYCIYIYNIYSETCVPITDSHGTIKSVCYRDEMFVVDRFNNFFSQTNKCIYLIKTFIFIKKISIIDINT